jgi:hypothetical protein
VASQGIQHACPHLGLLPVDGAHPEYGQHVLLRLCERLEQVGADRGVVPTRRCGSDRACRLGDAVLVAQRLSPGGGARLGDGSGVRPGIVRAPREEEQGRLDRTGRASALGVDVAGLVDRRFTLGRSSFADPFAAEAHGVTPLCRATEAPAPQGFTGTATTFRGR